jgi:Preprotein translocase subunit YidC
MESSMKSVNTVMPIMSAVMCFTFPIGIGIYWIAGGVVRSIQMILINKHMDKTDVNDLIKANQEKAKKKNAKKGAASQSILQQAQKSARNVDRGAVAAEAELKDKVTGNQNSGNVKAGSLASKANMVQRLNDKKK